MIGSPQSEVLKTLNYTTSEGDRKVTVWNEVCFYQSTGINSGFPGTWFPFKGIHELPFVLEPGDVVKPYYHRDGEATVKRNFAEINNEIDTVMGAVKAEELKLRFGSIPCMLMSCQIGGGIWDNEAKVLKTILMRKYPDFFKTYVSPHLNPPEATLRIVKEQSVDDKIQAAKSINAWLKKNIQKSNPNKAAQNSFSIPLTFEELPAPRVTSETALPTMTTPVSSITEIPIDCYQFIAEHGQLQTFPEKKDMYVIFNNPHDQQKAHNLITQELGKAHSRVAAHPNAIAISPEVLKNYNARYPQKEITPSNPAQQTILHGTVHVSEIKTTENNIKEDKMDHFLNHKNTLQAEYQTLREQSQSRAGHWLLHHAKRITDPISIKGKLRAKQLDELAMAFSNLFTDKAHSPQIKAELMYDLLSKIEGEVKAKYNVLSSGMDKLCKQYKQELISSFPSIASQINDEHRKERFSTFMKQMNSDLEAKNEHISKSKKR